MNRLEQAIEGLKASGTIGLAPYVTAGDGGLDLTLEVLFALQSSGAACVELGVPFSDPIADGPVLQAAAQRALDAGTTLDGILDLVARFRAQGGTLPILLFSYSNPLFHRGIEDAARALAQAGADGWLIPDVPVEEMEPWAAAARTEDLAPVAFVTPTTSDARIARASELSRGFVYVIGRTGITGARTDLGDDRTQAFLGRVKERCALPLGVGFGIRSADQVEVLAPHAALAIVGSALVQHLHEAREAGRSSAEAATGFMGQLRPR